MACPSLWRTFSQVPLLFSLSSSSPSSSSSVTSLLLYLLTSSSGRYLGGNKANATSKFRLENTPPCPTMFRFAWVQGTTREIVKCLNRRKIPAFCFFCMIRDGWRWSYINMEGFGIYYWYCGCLGGAEVTCSLVDTKWWSSDKILSQGQHVALVSRSFQDFTPLSSFSPYPAPVHIIVRSSQLVKGLSYQLNQPPLLSFLKSKAENCFYQSY